MNGRTFLRTSPIIVHDFDNWRIDRSANDVITTIVINYPAMMSTARHILKSSTAYGRIPRIDGFTGINWAKNRRRTPKFGIASGICKRSDILADAHTPRSPRTVNTVVLMMIKKKRAQQKQMTSHNDICQGTHEYGTSRQSGPNALT